MKNRYKILDLQGFMSRLDEHAAEMDADRSAAVKRKANALAAKPCKRQQHQTAANPIMIKGAPHVGEPGSAKASGGRLRSCLLWRDGSGPATFVKVSTSSRE